MNSPSPLPLVAQALSAAGVTMLAQLLSDDKEAQVVALDAAPVRVADPLERHERLRLAWAGPKGEGNHLLLLKVLSALTWSEAVNLTIPAPVEVLFVESDLATVLDDIVANHVVAAARRNETRPAWLLYHDLQTLLKDNDRDTQRLVLEKTATFHALHWGATAVLDDVYPWLPRFAQGVQAHLAFLAAIVEGEPTLDLPYERWALQRWPTLPTDFRAFWQHLAPVHSNPLRTLFQDPTPLLERLAHSPQTLLHGAWRRETLLRHEERLLSHTWGFLQIGPAAWDLCTYLGDCLYDGSHSLSRSEAIALYLDQVATIITELSDTDRLLFEQSYDLCWLLNVLLHPQRYPALFAPMSPDGTEKRRTDLLQIIERLL
ncbi:MAG: hypothetical protein H0T73_07140 [Ardenticatenales bacterium]|nr:hypothetical protein [Ardenticatenales bacterium]